MVSILQIPVSKRREVRKVMEDIRDKSKKQKEMMYDLCIQPYDDRIKAIDRFLKNELTNKQCVHVIERTSARIKEILGSKNKKKKKKKK